MKQLLANRVKTLTPSSTLAITAKAKELKNQGIDVIGLGAGEPDFNTPQNIIDAAVDSMNKGLTKYTPAGGLPVLKQAIIDKLQRDNQLTYKPNEIIVGVGAKHVLYTLFQVLLNPGDEVIIPIPYWVSYPEQVKLAGGVPVHIEGSAAQNYKITATQLRDAIPEITKHSQKINTTDSADSFPVDYDLLLKKIMCGVAVYEFCGGGFKQIFSTDRFYEIIGYTKEEYKEITADIIANEDEDANVRSAG